MHAIGALLTLQNRSKNPHAKFDKNGSSITEWRMGQEADVRVYDELHSDPTSNVPVAKSFYYPLFRTVVAEVERRAPTTVLEVGCGSGGLAQLLMDRTAVRYCGFDLSPVGVRNAARRTNRPDAFFAGNALDPSSYWFNYDAIICIEVLEHITRDLDVIKIWKAGTRCICSVPNFDYATHVRHFRTEEEILSRYGQLIDINSIVRVAKPVLLGNTTLEYLRRLRWARDQPKKFLGLLGVNTFDWYAGWFVFSGRRKQF